MRRKVEYGLFKGVKKDLLSAGLLLGIVFLLSLFLGISLIFLMRIGEGLALLGSIVFILFTPIFLVAGVFFGRWLHRRSETSDGKFIRMFQEKELHLGKYSKRFRNRFIQQRFLTLAIMVSIFFFATILLGILLIVPEICCVCFPISFPLLLIAITAPAVGWVLFTYAFDPYEPEPRAMLILGITWGMISTFPSLFLNTFNASWMDPMGISVGVVSAPIFEELFKAIGFVLVFSYIKDETDGVIYGATFGAGFALLENIFYSTNSILDGAGVVVIILIMFRSFFNIVGHMIGPVLIGFLIGNARNRYMDKPKEKGVYIITLVTFIIIGYVFGMLVHAGWNFLAGSDSILFLMIFPYGIGEILFFIGIVLFTFFIVTRRYQKRLREYAAEEDWDR